MSAATTTLSEPILRIAAQQTDQFTGHNLHVRHRGIVHAVGREPWLGDIELAAPACHVGTGVTVFDLVPTPDPVTCQRAGCRDVGEADSQQLALFD